jgi:hypothetical protein
MVKISKDHHQYALPKVAVTLLAQWAMAKWDEGSKQGRRPTRLCTMLIGTTVRAILPGVKRAYQVYKRVRCVYRQTTHMGKKVANQVATSSKVPSLIRWVEVICLVSEFAKMNYDDTINGTAVSRTAVSCARWVAIAVNMSESMTMDYIEHSKVIQAVICIYVMAGIWKGLENYLLCLSCEVKATDRKEEHVCQCDNERVDIDGEVYFDCDQGCDHHHGEQEEAEMDVTVMPATMATERLNSSQRDLGYDSDVYWMAVDNCCSSCITKLHGRFRWSHQESNGESKRIRGVHIIATVKGVFQWRITDNDGRCHTFLIRDSYYHENSPY